MGHSRTPTQNTAGEGFRADPIDGVRLRGGTPPGCRGMRVRRQARPIAGPPRPAVWALLEVAPVAPGAAGFIP
jgi:hypothetical protein